MLLCAALLALLATQDDAYGIALARVEEGDFRAAWSALEQETDPVRLARGRSMLYLRAGDFTGELESAEVGLTHAPEDQELLYFAAQAALWLRDDERADAYLDRLERALAQNPPPDPGAWDSLVESYRANAVELEQARVAREGAVARGQWVSLGILATTLMGLAVLAFRAGPRVPPGTRAR